MTAKKPVKKPAKKTTKTVGKTMVMLVLDRSGSMSPLRLEMIGGVNNFLKEQQALDEPAVLGMVRFDSQAIERFRPFEDLKNVKPLEADEYQPRSCTPLLDAVGKTLIEMEADWKTHKPTQCIMLIVTDGLENSSVEFNKQKIKDMITSRQQSGKWAFIYLGANVDAFHEAGQMGIPQSNTAGYTASAAGTSAAFAAMGETVSYTRTTGAKLSTNLGVKNLGEDEKYARSVKSKPQVKTDPEPKWQPPK